MTTDKRSITSHSKFSRPPGVLLREIDGELLLLNSSSDGYFGLNPTGAAMFQALVDGADVGQTVAAVGSEFAAPEEKIDEDLRALITELVANGLLTEAG